MPAELPENFLLRIERDIDIDAPVAVAFEALLEQLGPGGDTPEGKPLPLKLEPWPGGRWYRDLGNDAGHLWGHVQVIKPPTLLELSGPLFMSYPTINHLTYRLTERGAGAHLSFVHRGIGEFTPEHREGVVRGWGHILARAKGRAER